MVQVGEEKEKDREEDREKQRKRKKDVTRSADRRVENDLLIFSPSIVGSLSATTPLPMSAMIGLVAMNGRSVTCCCIKNNCRLKLTCNSFILRQHHGHRRSLFDRSLSGRLLFGRSLSGRSFFGRSLFGFAPKVINFIY